MHEMTVQAAPASETQAGEAFQVDFLDGCPTLFEASDGWTNGGVFDVFWHKGNVTFHGGNMQLVIKKDDRQNLVPYSGGELQSKRQYGYGRYETSMKAIKNDGVVSSFFVYTGPSDGNPWDEIDFEVLGKDTTKVQLNYFRDGQGGHEKMIDLGFDASKGFHTYAFEWRKNSIVWFVDGKEVFRREGDNLPRTKAKVMMNAWCGIHVDDWLKPFNPQHLPLQAEYQWIKYTPFTE